MYIMIDNYDSFTYNLVHLMHGQGAMIRVYRNDQITLDEIAALNPEGLIISPGPGRPEQAGISLELVRRFKGIYPILGVCLGHQTIASAFGADIIHAKKLFHGKGSKITHDNKGLFADVPLGFFAMRYHSLAVDAKSLPDCLEITARSDDDEIMGLRHKEYPIFGVQFHPESVAAEEGEKLMSNFIKRCKK
jgi:anthranilate synthase component 2